MCIPVIPLIGLAISAASAVMAYQQGQKQTKAAEASARNAAELNNQAYAQQAQQINQQASDAMSDRAREAMIERGRLRVISAESGVGDGSGSQDQLTRQSYFDEGYDMSRIESNRSAKQDQAQLDARGGQAATQSRLNAIEASKPSLIGTGLQIAGAGAAAYQKTKQIEAQERRA